MADQERNAQSQNQRERTLYIISVAAELAGVHAQTLRIYERKGLIEPARTQGGSRRYSDHDIDRLRRIQELTNQGVSLVGVAKLLEMEARLAQAQARIRELEATRRDLVPMPKRPSAAIVPYRRSGSG
jgi:MerR family transcriptional regulator/heat shock protein HspR